eukprot:5882954-Prymnesium_polylepis.1
MAETAPVWIPEKSVLMGQVRDLTSESLSRPCASRTTVGNRSLQPGVKASISTRACTRRDAARPPQPLPLHASERVLGQLPRAERPLGPDRKALPKD